MLHIKIAWKYITNFWTTFFLLKRWIFKEKLCNLFGAKKSILFLATHIKAPPLTSANSVWVGGYAFFVHLCNFARNNRYFQQYADVHLCNYARKYTIFFNKKHHRNRREEYIHSNICGNLQSRSIKRSNKHFSFQKQKTKKK